MPSLQRNGQRVAYSALGSGPDAVLLAHNLMAHRGTFSAVAARLAPRCRLAAVDLRGHGESGGAPRPFTADDLADDLVAVLDELGWARAVLVGTSLGATAAMLLAQRHPQRVRGLVLASATPHAATRRDRLRFHALAAVLRTLGPTPVMAAILEQLLGASYRAREPAGVAAVAAQIRASERRDLAFAVRAWVGRPALLGALAELRMPTVVVTGAEDTACPRRFAEDLVAALPAASLRVVAGAGHSVQLEQPAALAEIVEELLASLPA